jgi:hypothetical protein
MHAVIRACLSSAQPVEHVVRNQQAQSVTNAQLLGNVDDGFNGCLYAHVSPPSLTG